MKLSIVITSADAETVNNALRLATFSQSVEDDVTVFLLGAGVELERIPAGDYPVREKACLFLDQGGDILACGTCLEQRGMGPSPMFVVSNLKALRDLIADSDRTVTF